MLEFTYIARDPVGNKEKGTIEASDTNHAAKILQEKGYIIISLQLKTDSFVGLIKRRFFSQITLKHLVNFTRQFSTMINAGLGITDALNILKAQSDNPNFATIIGEILHDVETGSSLSDALKKYSIFDEVYVSLVKAGETAGVLDKILNRLADNMEKKKEFVGKVKGAMIYPIIIITGMIILSIIMLIFVFPRLLALYEEFQAQLPLPTLIVMAISKFATKFWWLVFTLLFAGAYFLRTVIRTPSGGFWFDGILFKIPIIGSLRKTMILTEFARTLGLLVGAGVLIVEALNVLINSLSSPIFREATKEATRKVEKGSSLAVSLAKAGVFPPLLPQMVSVGEESGKLEEVLLKVSSYFEQESDVAVRTLTTAVEPIIMVILGLGVGFLIVSVVMPIYNLTSQF